MTEFARAVLARRHRNGEIVNAVARKYGIAAKAVPARDHAEAYWLAACLMRRAGNLSLQDVADRFGVSIGRISQIQSKIETARIAGWLKGC